MTYFRDGTCTSHLEQVVIVIPGYIYIYSPRFVKVCFTAIHSDEDFENGKPKI